MAARDLWVTGAGTMRGQVATLEELAGKPRAAAAPQAGDRTAREATTGPVAWLDEQAPSKTGPSGVGRKITTGFSHVYWSR
jgi:hypothetical protein